jgi:rhodanese-related sulfurtransferase
VAEIADRPDLASRVGALVERARASLHRLSPTEAYAAQAAGALLVDTRTPVQRLRQGELLGALVIDRTVLEWRLDPSSGYCIPEALSLPRVVVVCRQGFSSSLAAASLCELGVDATDVVGGVEGWIAAGLPTIDGPADVRE